MTTDFGYFNRRQITASFRAAATRAFLKPIRFTSLSRQPDAPHIAGQNAFYLREQLLKYHSGQRVHPAMNVVALRIVRCGH
jgi:hypothetical protein